MIEEKLLKREEKAAFALRSLYGKYGYLPYKMGKFEEYELYSHNKDFLVSNRIITFNDTNGKLMALKPDVTLSIIKNGADEPGNKQKVCYNENVYRVPKNGRCFKEMVQAGVECIGELDAYDRYEIIALAAQSLAALSDRFVLEISHLGIVSAILDGICPDEEFQKKFVRLIAEKNSHDLERLCEEQQVSERKRALLLALLAVYGERHRVLVSWQELCGIMADNALEELEQLSVLLDTEEFGDRILFDLSVVNDFDYYDGIVFRGFVEGVSDVILSGGQYSKLMRKMNRDADAIGFAVYLDLLEQLPEDRSEYDVDVLLLYDDSVAVAEVAKAVKKLQAEGKTVSVQTTVPQQLRCGTLLNLGKEGKKC